MRPARSMSATLRPRLARSSAAVAPDGPPPTTMTSKISSAAMAFAPSALLKDPCRKRAVPPHHDDLTLLRRAVTRLSRASTAATRNSMASSGEDERVGDERLADRSRPASTNDRRSARRPDRRRWPALHPTVPSACLRATPRRRLPDPSSSRSRRPRRRHWIRRARKQRRGACLDPRQKTARSDASRGTMRRRRIRRSSRGARIRGSVRRSPKRRRRRPASRSARRRAAGRRAWSSTRASCQRRVPAKGSTSNSWAL